MRVAMERERLEACGIDYQEGLHRFSENVKIYEKYIKRLPGLDIYENMKRALAEEDCHTAFEECHKLKAFIGNLGIHPFYEDICELTDELRKEQGVSGEMLLLADKIEKQYQRLVDAIESD